MVCATAAVRLPQQAGLRDSRPRDEKKSGPSTPFLDGARRYGEFEARTPASRGSSGADCPVLIRQSPAPASHRRRLGRLSFAGNHFPRPQHRAARRRAPGNRQRKQVGEARREETAHESDRKPMQQSGGGERAAGRIHRRLGGVSICWVGVSPGNVQPIDERSGANLLKACDYRHLDPEPTPNLIFS